VSTCSYCHLLLVTPGLPPGKVEPRHRHPHGLSVYFTDWDAKVQVDGAAAEVHPRKSGTFALKF